MGAAGLTEDGRIISGCNVENASLGLTLCAECGLISELHRTGGGRLVAFACVDRTGATLMPCGRCRQLLWEHAGADLMIWAGETHLRLEELLPRAFDAHDMRA